MCPLETKTVPACNVFACFQGQHKLYYSTSNFLRENTVHNNNKKTFK